MIEARRWTYCIVALLKLSNGPQIERANVEESFRERTLSFRLRDVPPSMIPIVTLYTLAANGL